MTILDWIEQGAGFLGIIAGIWAASRKSDKQLMQGFMLSNLLVSTQMLLAGAYATAGSGLVSAIRLYFANKTRATWVMLVFMVLLVIQWWAVGRWVELFLVLGSLLGTYGYFKLEGYRLRLSLILMNVFWCPVLVYFDAYLPALFYATNSALMIPALRKDWREKNGAAQGEEPQKTVTEKNLVS
tara:strand:- start:74 stop:625 length:552 start_codon:yes stop_codon:yes gene_type:complete